MQHWKIDRIEEVEVTPLQFQQPEGFDLRRHFAKSFGIFHGEGEVHVKVRFSPTVARYVQEGRWHETERLTRQPDGSLLAEFDLSATEEIKRWILGFGKEAEVLEPAGLRKAMLREAQALSSANFLTQMTLDLAKLDILPDAGSKEGFANALASKAPGGIELMPNNGSIRRDVTVGLAALRRLAVLNADGSLSRDRTTALRRYILGLALVALTAPHDPYLRQGCNLVPDCKKPRDFKVVNLDGARSDIVITHDDAVAYARSAMKEFGIGPNREERFDATLAEKAAEAKPEKLEGNVVSVDPARRTFKLKAGRGKEAEITVNDSTVIKKGKEPATFDEAVAVGATLNVEVLNSVAVAITAKK